VHLVGFTKEKYYDARPYKRQIQHSYSTNISTELLGTGRSSLGFRGA